MNDDHFEDVRGTGELGGYGVLGGEAIQTHTKSTAKMTKEGVDYSLFCDQCGTKNRLSVSWAEFLYARNRHVPYDSSRGKPWQYDGQHGGFHPNVGCGRCRMVLLLILTPAESQKWLAKAEEANYLPRGWTQAQSQTLLQRAGRGAYQT
jgi:hypothetical protein